MSLRVPCPCLFRRANYECRKRVYRNRYRQHVPANGKRLQVAPPIRRPGPGGFPGRWGNLAQRRNPTPHNGAAKVLFAADLQAIKEGRLSHPHEEKEKMLLRIGERLGLRGPDIDKFNEQAQIIKQVKRMFQSINVNTIL